MIIMNFDCGLMLPNLEVRTGAAGAPLTASITALLSYWGADHGTYRL
jgi:hypothetical protein